MTSKDFDILNALVQDMRQAAAAYGQRSQRCTEHPLPEDGEYDAVFYKGKEMGMLEAATKLQLSLLRM